MKRFLQAVFILLLLSLPAFSATWYVNPSGGPRYDATYRPTGDSCNGQSNAAMSTGGGPNQACAYQEFQFLWDTGTGSTDHVGWVISGGDTVNITGCTAYGSQVYSDNPHCRLGWSAPTGAANVWCYGVGNNGCYMPPVPSGSSGTHTRILGTNFAACNTGGATDPKLYESNLAQLFAGYGLTWAFNLSGSSYVDIQCLELTTHNKVSVGNTGAGGNCTSAIGSPAYPRACVSGSQPYDDYAQNGFLLTNTTHDVTFTDVYVHGMGSNAYFGPIGANITQTRVNMSFNAQSAWDFDDGSDTANGTGASITAHYIKAVGNGCYEEYPIVHSYPARACYDSNSAGFGDTYSGQDSAMASFIIDHYDAEYNTKDSFIGPHTQIANLQITDSQSIGNMGAQWKWGVSTNATVLFQNNLTVTNCWRMSAAVPGAAQNFNQSTGLGGSYLTNFCRAGGDGFAVLTRAGTTYNWTGNTIIAAGPTVFDLNCGYYAPGNVFNPETNCGTATHTFTDNNILGYTDPNVASIPGLFYLEPNGTFPCSTGTGATGLCITSSTYNNEYGIRNGDTCIGNVTCKSPQQVNQPTTPWPGSEAALDVFNAFTTGNSYSLATGSPLIHTGVAVSGLTTDYYGTTRPNPPSIGGVELSGPPPVLPPLKFTGILSVSGTTSAH